MDPVTIIVSALAAGAAAGLKPAAEKAITDAYAAFKTAMTKKFGSSRDLVEAVEKLEQRPDSAGRQQMLSEEVTAAKADQDEELLRAATALLEKVQAQPGGQQLIRQTVTGDQNVFSGTGDVTVRFGQPKE